MGWYGLSSPTGRNTVIVMLVFGALQTLCVLLRFCARKVSKMSLCLDDFLMLLGALSVWSTIAIGIAMVLYGGVGFHAMIEVPLADTVITLKLLVVAEVMYAVELGLIKVSLLLVYLRLFGVDSKFQIIIWVAMLIVISWAFGSILGALLVCSPFPASYDPSAAGFCGDRNGALLAIGALNMVADFMVMAIPIPHVLSLNLRVEKKIALIVCFCLGIFVSIISILRMLSLVALDFNDITFYLPMPYMWSVVEPCLAVICINLPLLRPLFGSAPSDDDFHDEKPARDNTKRSDSLTTISPFERFNSFRGKTETMVETQIDPEAQTQASTFSLGTLSPKASVRRPKRSKSTRVCEDSDSAKSETNIVANAAPPGRIVVEREYGVS